MQNSHYTTYSKVSTYIHRYHSWIITVGLSVIGLLLCYIAINDPTTGGDGDSISHYMFSRYSWEHPYYFIDQWAKPFFTLISSPFSQFGFAGMRLFNAVCTIGICFVLWHVAKEDKAPHPWMAPIFLLAIPYFTLKVFSGYTEYFYALLLTSSILLTQHSRYFWAAMIVSFFPFCRSEGLIAVGVYLVFLIWQREYKYVPVLLSGHIIYELLGTLIFDQKLGWTWNKIPYISSDSGYGNGGWFDMADQLYQLVEWPVLALTIVGLLFMLFTFLPQMRKATAAFKIKLLLIYGNALAFFVAHTLFWKFGLFNSFGLGRVFIAIMPLIALIAMDAFRVLDRESKLYPFILSICFVIVVTHPFNTSKGGFIFKRGMNNIPQHIMIDDQLMPYLDSKYSDRIVTYNAAYLAVARDENQLDQPISGTWLRKEDLPKLPLQSIYIWDSKFAQNEGRIALEALESIPQFQKDTCFVSDSWNGKYTYCIFEKIQD